MHTKHLTPHRHTTCQFVDQRRPNRISPLLSSLLGLSLLCSTGTSFASNAQDNAALQKLYDVLASQLLNDRPLEETLVSAFPIKRPISYFEQQSSDEQPLERRAKPDPSITTEEWQAVLNSPIEAYSESGNISYALMDLDSDGKRDLIIESYIGGTGLFSYTGVLKRTGDRFIPSTTATLEDDLLMPGEFFTENGRGANQWSTWIDIDGQIYALFFNGSFGQEKFYLLRPFHNDAEVPVVTVTYKTEFTGIAPPDKGARSNLAAYLDQKQLFSDLSKMQNAQTINTEAPAPICPPPANSSPEETETYHIGSALHYSVDGIGNLPVWAESSCYIGTAYSYFGLAPGARRAEAQIQLYDPQNPDSEMSELTVWGARKLHTMAAGWEAF